MGLAAGLFPSMWALSGGGTSLERRRAQKTRAAQRLFIQYLPLASLSDVWIGERP